MDNISKAIKVAMSVRSYLLENVGKQVPSSGDVSETQERIVRQINDISGLR